MRNLMLLLLGTLVVSAAAWAGAGIQVDPQTGRAVGAKEMSPAELRKLIDEHGKLLIIDVREPEAFQKETIKGAINIPLEQLKGRLKDIPKDTTLVFT